MMGSAIVWVSDTLSLILTYGNLVTTSPSSKRRGLLNFRAGRAPEAHTPPVRTFHRDAQSVGATGGVYKGQGRNLCGLMTRVY